MASKRYGNAEAHVVIEGLSELVRDLRPSEMEPAITAGIRAGAVVVQGAAIDNAARVTGKLQGSIGTELQGFGFNTVAYIGPQPGMNAPARYTPADTSHWQTPRYGINEGDPQEYGRFVEFGTKYMDEQPFLIPALEDNEERINEVVESAIDRYLATVGRQR